MSHMAASRQGVEEEGGVERVGHGAAGLGGRSGLERRGERWQGEGVVTQIAASQASRL